MKVFPIHEAKARLSMLIEKALSGEVVIIARGKTPIVKLVPVEETTGRKFGALKNKFKFDDSFFDPLPKEELAAWEK